MIFKPCEINNKTVFGRTFTDDNGMALFWSGSGVEFNMLAASLYVEIECGYEGMEMMLDIIIEGERTQKLVLENGVRTYQVFKGMNPEKQVNVRIIRDTQCMPEEKVHHLIIRSFETDGEFGPAPEYGYNMEFMGDSLTSGEGCGLTKREEWIPVVFDAVENYTYKTARLMNAKYSVISQSGWGLYASWDANLKNVLPDYYGKVCGTTADKACIDMNAHEEWEFPDSEKDVVLINLGTNDSGALNTGKFEKEEFLEAFRNKAVDFLRTVRKRNEASLIIWAYGMLGDDMEPFIKEAIETYKSESGDMRVEYLKLPSCTGEDLGARWHPTPKAHEKVAKCISEYLHSYQAFMLR